MENTTWMDWSGKQLADLAHKLAVQGYTPDRIEFLNRTRPEFEAAMDDFMKQIESVMDQLAEHPESYRFYEQFTEAKRDFLEFTNLHRGEFTAPYLAESA